MKLFLKTLELENFKGCKHTLIDFGDITSICGKNATGKSTLYDGFNWICFDKDSSGSQKFLIRTVDENGDPVHNLEIIGRAVIEWDGVPYELKKVQKEKWTKKRGSEVKELTANTNEFYINEFPKSKKEYEEFIASLIKEDDFRLLTDCYFFASMKADKKREKLLSLCGDYTPEDLLNSDPEHWKFIRDDVLLGGIDGAMAKAKKQLSRLKKEQEEVPIRIDEASKQLTDVPDIMSLEEQKATVLAKIKAKEEMISAVKSED